MKTLSEADNYRVATLARRVLHIQKLADELRDVPLESMHPETGVSVKQTLKLLLDAAGITEGEMLMVLDA